ncbi:hypothetical protein HHI36_013128 [Cryptolaemus montrouzieri]|uniref:Uncharacterized protein n=1 Tax=Cryptolaemus montrouzieri TaxID=559131 RepID=A0ABD2NGE1_9CUCU
MSVSSPGELPPGLKIKLTNKSKINLEKLLSGGLIGSDIDKELLELELQEFSRDKAVLNEIKSVLGNKHVAKHLEKTHEQIMNKISTYRYSNIHKGPFTVIIDSLEQNIGNLNPASIGKIIYNKNNYKNLDITRIDRKGRNRIGITFRYGNDANKFLENNDFDKNKYNIYIPARMISVMGIVRDIGQDITEEDIIEHGKGWNRVIWPCKKLCRAAFRCVNCGETHDNESQCDSEPVCIFCKEKHPSNSRDCSEYRTQMKIRETMAYYNVSFFEAINSLKHPTPQRLTDFPNLDQNNHDSQPLTKIFTQKRSYAEVLEKNNTPNTPQTGKKITVITPPKVRALDNNTGYNKAEHESCLIKYNLNSMPMFSCSKASENSSIIEKPYEEAVKRANDTEPRKTTTYHESYFHNNNIQSPVQRKSNNNIQSPVQKKRMDGVRRWMTWNSRET